jgi:hypothetical protein
MVLTSDQREFILFVIAMIQIFGWLYVFGNFLLWRDSRKQKRKNEDIS